LATIKEEKGAENDTDLSADDMKLVVDRYREVYKKAIGSDAGNR
jgi:pyruvate,orthophosphate dikinase